MSCLLNVYVYSTVSGKINSNYYTFDINDIASGINFTEYIDEDIGLAIYVNRVLYETIVAAMKTDKYYFNSNHMATMTTSIYGMPIEVAIKSFEDGQSHSTTDFERSLRIKTALGIGYISLLEDKEIDAYKICVGYESDGTPIIRRLETTNADIERDDYKVTINS